MNTFTVILFSLLLTVSSAVKFDPTWDSLDTRPLPTWYNSSKIGIFLHWGVYSVPSYHSEWFWSVWKEGTEDVVNFMKQNYKPDFSYQDFAPEFTAEFFNASEWAELFKKSGAKYVVLTSKHHEGFTLWPSEYSYSWNAKDVGPHRDIIAELSEAVRNENLRFGVYHSLYEWFNPMYLADKADNTTIFVDNKIYPEMLELVNKYKPEILWSDGEWEQPDTYWRSTEFLAWLFNESPVKDSVVVNDRWGSNTLCKHGDFYTCSDRYNPGVLQSHPWENAMTLDRVSWGYRRNAKLSDFLTINELLSTLASTVSCGGNLLINVGPTKEGTIVPIFQERLEQLGKWLSINGDAVYDTIPWTAQNDTNEANVWYTSKENSVYAILLNWPESGNEVKLQSIIPHLHEDTNVQLLGNDETLKWSASDQYMTIGLPDKSLVNSEWAWVLKIT